MFGRVIKKRLESVFDFPIYWVKTLKEVKQLLAHSGERFAIALLDINLTDGPRGEVINEVAGRGIASIVLASNISAEVRELIWSHMIADYILKDDPNSLDYIVSSITRLVNNENCLVLLVESDEEKRGRFSDYLYAQRLRVLTGKSGKIAMDTLERQKEVRLLITAHQLPDMTGWELCRRVRETRKLNDLAILGLYSRSSPETGIHFLKSGASEIIGEEDLLLEEFYSRLNRCLELIEVHQ